MLDLSYLGHMLEEATNEGDGPIDFYNEPIAHSDFFSPPKLTDILIGAPEIVKTLMGAGFYLHGSRSKLPSNVVGDDADWDLTYPVLDSGAYKTENTELVKSLGFDLVIDEQDGYSGSEMVQCPNFSEYWVHVDEPITIIRRKDERLFRQAWDAIGPYAFEQFVWKRAYHNRNSTLEEIRWKRHMFMQTMYSAILGREVICSLTS